MNYLLYGEDTYRSRIKLHEIVDACRAKHGASIDLHWVDAGEGDVSLLEEASGTASLFSRKKTIVVERAVVSGAAPERLVTFLKKNKGSRDIIVIVWEEAIGEREKKFFAQVEMCADKTQEFDALTGPRLARWIQEEAGRRGITVSPADRAHLAGLGPNLWAVTGEMEKIAVSGGVARAPSGARAPSSVFDLGDAFFSSQGRAIHHLLSLAEQGGDDLPLFTYLVNYNRTLLVLKICAEERMPVPPALAIHPFVVQKTSRLAAGIDRNALIRTMRRFFEEDAAMKTNGATAREALISMIIEAGRK